MGVALLRPRMPPGDTLGRGTLAGQHGCHPLALPSSSRQETFLDFKTFKLNKLT